MADTNTPTPETSNTLSFSDLRAALSGKEATTETPKPAVTPAEGTVTPPATAEEGTIEEPKEGVVPPAAVEPPPGDKKDRRFSKVTKDRDAALARAQALELEVAALRAGTAAKPAEAAPTAAATEVEPVYPDAESFTGTWQELEAARKQYAKDLAKFEVKQALRQSAAEAQVAQQRTQAEQVQQTFQEQVDAALDEHGENFETAYKEVGAALSKTGVADIVKESPVAAELILALHKDKALLDKLPTLSLARRATEVAKVEARIEAAKGTTGTTGTAAATAAPVKPLPKPPAVVGGAAGSDPTSPKLEEITDFRTFKAAVNKARAK